MLPTELFILKITKGGYSNLNFRFFYTSFLFPPPLYFLSHNSLPYHFSYLPFHLSLFSPFLPFHLLSSFSISFFPFSSFFLFPLLFSSFSFLSPISPSFLPSTSFLPFPSLSLLSPFCFPLSSSFLSFPLLFSPFPFFSPLPLFS